MYRGLPIITNQITPEERRGVMHHLIDMIEHHEPTWTVQNFAREARRAVHDIRARGKLPIVVGGTHYYINALLFEDSVLGPQNPTGDCDGNGNGNGNGENRSRFEAEEETSAQFPILDAPTDVMLARLRQVDPIIAERWHPSDRRKIRRSLEIYLTTGRRASDIYAEQKQQQQSNKSASGETGVEEEEARSSPWEALMFWVYSKPEALHERLNRRVDRMAERGLMTEVRDLHEHLRRRTEAGEVVDRTKGIWQSIGFRQLEPFLDAERDLAHAPPPPEEGLQKLREAGLEDMRVATRQYARAQLRWIRGKTVPELRTHGAMRHLYLLDSTDAAGFEAHVLAPAAAVCHQFLEGTGADPPRPRDLSATANEVLGAYEALAAEKPVLRQKTCETCHTTVLEHLWEEHLKGKKHRRFLKHKSRTALVPFVTEAGSGSIEPVSDSIPVNPDAQPPGAELSEVT